MSYDNPPPGGPGQPPSGQGQYGYPTPPPSGSNEMETSDGGFFSALFDFSFTQFVTPKIVKLVYVLALIGLLFGYVAFVIVSFARNPVGGLVVLVIGAVAVIIYLAFIRMTLEFYYAIVRMSQDINRRLPGA